VYSVNAEADSDPQTIRISVDTKAVVNLGGYSRGGRSRGKEAVAALDHDMRPKEKLVPGGILEVVSGRAFLFFSASNKTSDFMVDGLEAWWELRQPDLPQVKRVVINMDNGPECNAHRSQFLHRMAAFADATGLRVRLVYYPPYHSKYNPIEHYWGGLERSWNGYLLDSVECVLRRAASFAWHGVRATVTLLQRVYAKGVRLAARERARLEDRIQRSGDLPWWDVTIAPVAVV
jgi:hypothetical protein